MFPFTKYISLFKKSEALYELAFLYILAKATLEKESIPVRIYLLRLFHLISTVSRHKRNPFLCFFFNSVILFFLIAFNL
ncbi:MAG: hypothetical protein US76_02150 [Parcubacteria group bacterium GW2011_GWA2_38_13b]|nr:MAG: hypothetical protein US76_02150 [Parcubacteria group bacterium GW2011_GWA2_38_13b]